jgi:hypothetical protein
MNTAKKLLFIVGAFALGGLFLITGLHEFRQSRRLAAEGKTTVARVVDERTVYRSKGRSRYYLTVEFETAAKQFITQEVKVDYSTHSAGSTARSVKVHYLPSDPLVLQAGDAVETRFEDILFGLLFVGAGVVLAVFYKQPATRQELADTTQEHLERLCDASQQYVPVEAKQFKQVDLAFYDRCQQQFETRGFVFLEDVEVVASKPNKSFARTFVRVLISPDRARIASVFSLKPGWMLRVLGAREARVWGVETQFSNNTFVCTDNAEACNALENAPAINVSHLPAASTVEMVAESHDQRLVAHAAANPGAVPVRMNSAADVHRAMELQQQIKAAFRRGHGLSKAELERLGGATNNPVINDLHADLTRRQEQRREDAA